MKFFITFALIAAVASATIVAPSATISSELQEIIAAINSPSTDPATAAALEQILLESMGVSNPEPIAVGPAVVDAFEPISVGPAIVDSLFPISVGPAIVGANPISVGPAMIDFPVPDGGAVSAPVEVSPVAVSPTFPTFPTVPSNPPSAATPLVQIILNINQVETADASPVAVAPVVVAPVEAPEPITVVESAAEPIAVPSPVIVAPSPVVVPEAVIIVPESVSIVDTAPVSVVDSAPVVVDPVVIGTPILPSPAVVLPETLN